MCDARLVSSGKFATVTLVTLLLLLLLLLLFSLALQSSAGYGLLVTRGFVNTQRRATVDRSPLDE
jgi:hypothetical protein